MRKKEKKSKSIKKKRNKIINKKRMEKEGKLKKKE